MEHFFRHRYGELVAVLVRRVGFERLEEVEDAVQAALLAALMAWAEKGVPPEPSAWLYRVAHNQLIGTLRKAQGRARLLEREHEPAPPPLAAEEPALGPEVKDELLRMLFVCCDARIPRESQLVIALKTLCGFSTAEIALRLFTSEANVHKRLARARERLRESALETDTPPLDQSRSRLPGVHAVIYTLFNEGYLSARAEQAVRRELCDEAIRLGTLLASHPVGAAPETCALLALMHLHDARLSSRHDAAGGLLLLEEQDRSLWDSERIAEGIQWLARSAGGEAPGRYHVEAAIAAEHCLAPSFAATRWDEIAGLYAMLERIDPSPLHTLNRAVATAEARGPHAGLELLTGLEPPTWLSGSYLWASVLADLHRRAGNDERAADYRERALATAPTEHVRELLERRLSIPDAR